MEIIEIQAHIVNTATAKNWKVQENQKKLTSLVEIMKKKAVDNTIICPCKVYVPDLVDISAVKCPCPGAEEDIEKYGACHCGLFSRGIVKIKPNEFAYPVYSCQANKGICHKIEPCCNICDIAKKAVHTKLLYTFALTCPTKTETDMCEVRLTRCNASECVIAARVADEGVKEIFKVE